MFKSLLANLSDTPKQVSFKNIPEIDRMEQRFFAVEQYYGDIIGMNVDCVEFCPNHKPPDLKSEILPWLWIIHPELRDEISEIADNHLKDIIRNYEKNEP